MIHIGINVIVHFRDDFTFSENAVSVIKYNFICNYFFKFPIAYID